MSGHELPQDANSMILDTLSNLSVPQFPPVK